MFIQPDKTIANIDYAPEDMKGWLVTEELAEKITANYPNFNFVLDGDKLDDIQTEPEVQDADL